MFVICNELCWCVFSFGKGGVLRLLFGVYMGVYMCVFVMGLFLHFAIDEYHIIVCITSNLKKAYGK